MRNLWVATRTAPLNLRLIAVGLIVFLIAKIIWFDHMPERFPNAYEFGRLAQDLSVATVAAFIFFLFSYQLPFVIEQQRVGPHVLDFMRKIADLVKQPIRQIYLWAEGDRTELPDAAVTDNLIHAYFGKIALAKVDEHLNRFTDAHDKSLEYITAVWGYSRFIDPEVLSVISKLELSEYSKNLPMYREAHGPNSGGTLIFLASAYYWHFRLAVQLSKLADELQTRYQMPTSYLLNDT